ncbi:MAG: cytochrome c oxidase assembly protein [Ponticaulis sp.]|nr:cytochrome c oxidase assembly protein [Ponticaulis sp.]
MNKNALGFVIGGVAFGMLGLAFASKPLYDTFCRVTGYGGTTQVATERPEGVIDRKMLVRLDTNIRGLPFEFRPLDGPVEVQVGETAMVKFELTNTSDRPIRAIASYNVTPFDAGTYFTKLQCFCFDEQTYEPGETVVLPVIFFVNPLIEEEATLDDVKAITLSYTYYEAEDNKDALASLSNLVSEDE